VKDRLWNKTILIDLPDYDEHSCVQMNADLADIHKLWEDLGQDSNRPVNIVLFLHKEIFHDHFLFGKLDVVDLEVPTPSELVQHYEELFKNTDPFEEAALLEIANLSRGIFRRFKKYVRICLDNYYDNVSCNRITY
jgi:hypothetical protein